MRKLKALVAALLALANANAIAQPVENSLLWKISGKEVKKPSYLFGTMHLICKGDFLWTTAMRQSLDNSEKVCLEMDMDDTNIATQVAAGMIDKTGKKLSDYFTKEQYATVSKYIRDNYGFEISLVEQMKPIALQTLITTQISECQDPVSYEDSIMTIAHKSKKEIVGLEDVREQLATLETIPTDTVIKELLEMVNGKSLDSEYNAMVMAYKNQDLPALYKQMQDSKDLQNELGVFLDDRNKKWIPRMEQKMSGNSVFFAVGAGHLWGNNGVINLLRKAGYKVEAMH